MKHTLSLIVACTLAVVLAACADKDKFKITGEISGKPTMNLYVKYYGNNAVQTAVTIADKGRFQVTGSSTYPTLVEFLDNEYNVIGRAYVQNGDNVQLTLDRHNPYRIEARGTDINERWAKAVSENTDSFNTASAMEVNALVEEYVAEHPDDVVSTLIFATTYNTWVDPLRADSVLQSIDAKARPSTVLAAYSLTAHRFVNPAAYEPVGEIRYRTVESDSGIVFTPSAKALSLIAFTDENSARHDSVVPVLKEIRKDVPESRLQIIDFFLPTDTFTFKRVLIRDSADWIQAWAPGALYAAGIDRLAIPRMPYYIVTDSAGVQLYRGTSLTDARNHLK